MRKIIVFAFIIICFKAFPQYERVIKDSTSFIYYNDVFMPIKAGQYNDSIYFQGDTVINTQKYIKVYDKAFCDEPPGFIKLEYNFLGFVREDTVQGKIWRLKIDSNIYSELLIYDISLTLGDSFNIWGKSYPVELDTTILGRKHIVISAHTFIPSSMKLEFIEGIGINCNFFNGTYFYLEPNWNYPLGSFLTCAFESHYLKYKNLTNSHAGQINVPFTSTSQCNVNCYWIGSQNEIDNQLSKVKIYPNPTNNELNIECYQNNDFTLSLFNISGQELFKQKINRNKVQIDVKKLSCGVYFVKLSNDKSVEFRKLIKE